MQDKEVVRTFQFVNASESDGLCGYLSDKLAAGTGITFDIIDPAGDGNKQLQITGVNTTIGELGVRNYRFGNNTLTSLDITSGTDNIAIGEAALTLLDDSGGFNNDYQNVAIGSNSLALLTVGTDNVGIGGNNVGPNLTTGYNNIFIGTSAGGNISSAGFNICIGYGTGFSADNGQEDCVVIGDQITPTIPANTPGWCVGRIGAKQFIFEGSNAAMGTGTLVAGSVTVANTRVTANTRIFTSRQAPGGTLGNISIQNVVAGTSFDIVSDNAADTSVIAWELKEPT